MDVGKFPSGQGNGHKGRFNAFLGACSLYGIQGGIWHLLDAACLHAIKRKKIPQKSA